MSVQGRWKRKTRRIVLKKISCSWLLQRWWLEITIVVNISEISFVQSLWKYFLFRLWKQEIPQRQNIDKVHGMQKKKPCPWDETWAMLSHPLFSFKTHKTPLVLTYLVVHLKSDVKLQNDQHELEPRAHLLVGKRNVDSKHNVVSLDPLGHGFIKGPDLITLLSTPRHEPFCLLRFVRFIHAFCGQVVHCCGGAGSWKDKVVEVRQTEILQEFCFCFCF